MFCGSASLTPCGFISAFYRYFFATFFATKLEMARLKILNSAPTSIFFTYHDDEKTIAGLCWLDTLPATVLRLEK